MSISIIDHGLSNISSIVNMLRHLNVYPEIISSPKDIKYAKKIIFPGIGAAQAVWKNLEIKGFVEPLKESVEIKKTPLLGVCVGMQLITEGSDEGNSPGFGWVKGKCVRFISTEASKIKIPHMGWNKVVPTKNKRLFGASCEPQKFYFVHSFHAVCEDKRDIAATCYYGGDFVAAIERENIFGVQFHPEKSHNYGMQLFENFLKI